MGIMEGEQMLLVPHWIIQQLYDPTTPGQLRQKGAEDAREYLRTHYGVDGEFTVFWWGTLPQALAYAAHYLSSIAKPDKYLGNHLAGK